MKAVRIAAGVARKADMDAKLVRAAEGGALRVGRFAVLAQIFLGPALSRADLVDIGAVVDVHREPGAVLFRELQRLLVVYAGVLDAVAPGPHRILAPLTAGRGPGVPFAAGLAAGSAPGRVR